jgi:hypothetical protein
MSVLHDPLSAANYSQFDLLQVFKLLTLGVPLEALRQTLPSVPQNPGPMTELTPAEKTDIKNQLKSEESLWTVDDFGPLLALVQDGRLPSDVPSILDNIFRSRLNSEARSLLGELSLLQLGSLSPSGLLFLQQGNAGSFFNLAFKQTSTASPVHKFMGLSAALEPQANDAGPTSFPVGSTAPFFSPLMGIAPTRVRCWSCMAFFSNPCVRPFALTRLPFLGRSDWIV